MNRLKASLGFAFFALLGSATVHAGIIWNGPSDISNVNDVSLAGELVEAVNLSFINSNDPPGTTEVNGVVFSNRGDLLDGNFAASFLTNGGGATATTGNAGYDALLDTLDFGNGTSFDLSLGGGALLTGRRYLVQVWFTDLRGCCNTRSMNIGDGSGNSVNLDATGGGLGQFAVGSFIASGSTQTLALATNDPDNFKNVHLTAYQVREVPAPSALALIGLGLVALTAAGRRRQQRNH